MRKCAGSVHLLFAMALLGIAAFSCGTKRSISAINIAKSYSTDPECLLFAMASASEDSLVVDLELAYDTERWGTDPHKVYAIYYEVFPDHSSKRRIFLDSLVDSSDWKRVGKHDFQLSFRLPKATCSEGLLLVSLYNRKNRLTIPYVHELRSLGNFTRFQTQDQVPWLKPYLNSEVPYFCASSDTFYLLSRLKARQWQSSPFYADAVKEDDYFRKVLIAGDARPLMLDSGRILMQAEDTSQRAFYVGQAFFPYPGDAREVLESLERLDLTEPVETGTPREALSKAWLNMGGQEVYAKEMAKEWYQRMEAANRLFTSHTAGWNTKRGMVYLVFGSPDEVYLKQKLEYWYYAKGENSGQMEFSFTKEGPNFGWQVFRLSQLTNWDTHWYEAIELWKNGTIPK